MSTTERTFGPVVEVCKAHGIGRTVAFDLVKKNLLQSFKIGTRRYVLLESVRTLPERLNETKEHDTETARRSTSDRASA